MSSGSGDWKKAPRDGASRGENQGTQPLLTHRVFNNPQVLTEGWYPVCASTGLKSGQTKSFKILRHRIALYRGDDGRARALDAFCPHMGADLGNGQVVGNELRCYFHHWQFNEKGELSGVGCGQHPQRKVSLRSWPCEEKYGFIWVYAGEKALHPVPSPPGLEGQALTAWHLRKVTLFAHHHVMMAGGIDLQHFATVHQLDIKFQYNVKEQQPQVFDWELEGEMPVNGWRAKLGRFILGSRFGYRARFAGGTVVTLAYGTDQRFRGRGRKLPSLYLLWGCTPLESGVSQVDIFVVAPKYSGVLGRLKQKLQLVTTIGLLAVLRDDDVKAFPNMRFNTTGLVAADASVAHFIKLTNALQISPWSGNSS